MQNAKQRISLSPCTSIDSDDGDLLLLSVPCLLSTRDEMKDKDSVC